jgi:hypothetical protein
MCGFNTHTTTPTVLLLCSATRLSNACVTMRSDLSVPSMREHTHGREPRAVYSIGSAALWHGSEGRCLERTAVTFSE